MREINKLRLKVALTPLLILFFLLLIPLPFYFYGVFSYLSVMPLVIFLSAFFIFFIGAWWDFGARDYIKELLLQGVPSSEIDSKAINREQLILTCIFLIIGGIYLVIAYLLSII